MAVAGALGLRLGKGIGDMATGAAATAARKRARDLRIKLDAERVAREARMEDAAADFFLADDELSKAIARADSIRSKAVARLAAEGENHERVAALVDVTVEEVRRLLKLAEAGPKRAKKAPGAVADEPTEDGGGNASEEHAA